jgi:hypothetical protein
MVPSYQPEAFQFNYEMFQLFFSLVMFHLPAYDLGQPVPISPALDTVGKALDHDHPSPIILEHIIRKFLIHCHEQFLQLTSMGVLSKISHLHNELYLASEVLSHKARPGLINYCDMLLAETYDLFNSEFAKRVNNDYWAQNKPVEAVIDELLTKEAEKIRVLCDKTIECLLQCIVKRSLDRAPQPAVQRIIQWAREQGVQLDKETEALGGGTSSSTKRSGA